jgi:hypothetical protein
MADDFVQRALGAIVRHGLTVLAGYLVANGIWTEDVATNFAGAAAVAIVALGWSLYKKATTRELPVPKKL